MPPRKLKLKVALAALLLLVAATGLLLAPRPATGDASGCVLNPGSIPIWGARCYSEPGFNCYRCEYTVSGETSTCSENQDGSLKFCINEEHQQDPPSGG